MSQEKYTVFVCADFHCTAKGEDGERSSISWFRAENYGKANLCPVTQLINYIKENRLRADIAICCGDLGDKADPEAANIAWKAFQALAKSLHAKEIFATAGNHDLDSRHLHNDYDARGHLQSLSPLFPVNKAKEFDRYWSRHFYLRYFQDFRILNINSSAYHGYKDEERGHGRISEKTLDAIESALNASEDRIINLLICHHPLQSQSELLQGEGDHVMGGDDLVYLLSEKLGQDWLMVYGHKHFPRLQYGRGTANQPVMLSSGTISAVPYAMYGSDAKNQVHLIDFDISYIKEHGLHGIVRSLEWNLQARWHIPRGNGGLGGATGFGYRASIPDIASEISKVVTPKARWEEIVDQLQAIQFVPRETIERVIERLDAVHSIGAVYDRHGNLFELARK